jgi:hypothetical protein
VGPTSKIQLLHLLSGPFTNFVQLPTPNRITNGHRTVQLVNLSLPIIIFFHPRPQIHRLPILLLSAHSLLARGQRPINLLTLSITGHAKEYQLYHPPPNNFTTLTILCRLLLSQDDRSLDYPTDPEHILCTYGGLLILDQLDELHKLDSLLGRGVSQLINLFWRHD